MIVGERTRKNETTIWYVGSRNSCLGFSLGIGVSGFSVFGAEGWWLLLREYTVTKDN